VLAIVKAEKGLTLLDVVANFHQHLGDHAAHGRADRDVLRIRLDERRPATKWSYGALGGSTAGGSGTGGLLPCTTVYTARMTPTIASSGTMKVRSMSRFLACVPVGCSGVVLVWSRFSVPPRRWRVLVR
jgi:hypothetical protein